LRPLRLFSPSRIEARTGLLILRLDGKPAISQRRDYASGPAGIAKLIEFRILAIAALFAADRVLIAVQVIGRSSQ